MTLLSSLFGKGLVSDAAYDAGWNGETIIAPSKNASIEEYTDKNPKKLTQSDKLLVLKDVVLPTREERNNIVIVVDK